MGARRCLRTISDYPRQLAWLAAGMLGLGVTATAAAQQAIDTELARAFFAEAEALGREGRPLWGIGLDGPMLFVDARTREAVANVADTLGVLREAAGVWVGVLPSEVGVANTAVDWAGRRWTMLVWPLPYGRLSRGRLMVHEMFHRVQPELGLAGADATNAHLDSEEGRLLLRLEWRALQLALADTGAARLRALSDAIWFRSRRQERFPAGAAEERALELNEGLAEYTGMRVALPANARAGWAAVQIENYDARASESAVGRSFAYATGPALGFLLDAADETWRTRVDGETDLSRLLAEAYGISADGERGLSERWVPYGGERLAVEESGRSRAFAAREARMRARFVDGPTLTLPATEEMRYTFNPGEVVPYGEGGTVYLTTEVRDTWGLLKVTMGGALLIREGRRIARIIVPAPGEGEPDARRGDGWTLDLRDGWELVPGGRAGDFLVVKR
jgi:hypothetical protein